MLERLPRPGATQHQVFEYLSEKDQISSSTVEDFSMEGMSAQAQQIWSMLDDMAENNPAAYSKFIDSQLKEGKEQMALPEPHMCVQVLLLNKSHTPLFVNFCSWNRIPEPKSQQDAVPVSGTQITKEVDEKGSFALTSVAFNPKVLKEYGREAKNSLDADTLIQLALDYIENEQKVKLSRSYTMLPEDMTHKGDLTLVQIAFTNLFKQNKQTREIENDDNDFDKIFSSSNSASEKKDSLLSQLSNINVGDTSDTGTRINCLQPSLNTSGKQNCHHKSKKCLIEEINSIKLQSPKYSLDSVDTDLGLAFVLKVNLPCVKSVLECQLDISEDDIELTVSGKFELKLKLPSCINDDEASAKFNKKLSTLTVIMPVKS